MKDTLEEIKEELNKVNNELQLLNDIKEVSHFHMMALDGLMDSFCQALSK